MTFRSAYETEWVVSAGDGDDFVPAAVGPAYGLGRLAAASDYGRDLLEAFATQGIRVEQLHPEYAPGQFEVSVAAEAPVAAADTSVLVRATIRAVGLRYGFRTSFSPKVDVAGVGNGGHLHVSPWRDGENLMAGGSGPYGMTPDGESFAGGVLAHLPALLALGAPSVASYLRLVPQHWAGAYACWGLENREAALRLVTGSAGSEPWAANLEVKCVDLHANPYLLLAGVLAAGADATPLPEPVDVDPASLGDDELARRGVVRLPRRCGSRSTRSWRTRSSGRRSGSRSSTRSPPCASPSWRSWAPPARRRWPTPPAGRTDRQLSQTCTAVWSVMSPSRTVATVMQRTCSPPGYRRCWVKAIRAGVATRSSTRWSMLRPQMSRKYASISAAPA